MLANSHFVFYMISDEAFTIEDFYYAFMDELQFYQRKLESGDSEYKAQDGMGNTAIDRMANSGHVCRAYIYLLYYVYPCTIYVYLY